MYAPGCCFDGGASKGKKKRAHSPQNTQLPEISAIKELNDVSEMNTDSLCKRFTKPHLMLPLYHALVVFKMP